MIIPHHMLSPEALHSVIEAFVTREGTDYGAHDIPLATKVLQVRQQLDAGTAVIVYDQETESCTLQVCAAPVSHGLSGKAEASHVWIMPRRVQGNPSTALISRRVKGNNSA